MNQNKNTAHVDSQTSEVVRGPFRFPPANDLGRLRIRLLKSGRYFQFLFTKGHIGSCITYYVTTDPGGRPFYSGVQIKFTFIDHGTADCGGSPFYSAISGSGILQLLRELYREEKRFVPAANR